MGGGGDPGKIRRLHYYHPVSSPVCLSHAADPELCLYNKPLVVNKAFSIFYVFSYRCIMHEGGNENPQICS